ncbi:PRADC1-like protein [Homalodisca vitripennis]|uniref:PRADC1-like protein n=1 Tax=Homalodisca vitripennis TaxID=197043 RepID=UPI001EEC0CE2|nr:PRADC1-like protein [Homalodisca vitripennis]
MNKNILILIFWFSNRFPFISMGANNLHKFDGTSITEIVGDDVFFEIVEPEELSYTYRTRPAKNFGTKFNVNFSHGVIPLVPVDPADGCSWPDNANDLRGNIVLAERGECSFLSKAIKAEQVGAVAIIIADYDVKNDDLYVEMIDDKTLRKTNIPATFLVGRNGYIIRKTLKKLRLKQALIRIPLNMTHVPVHKMRQPPWVPW